MAKPNRRHGWPEACLAALMLASFFRPWIYSLGKPVAAHEIRERLAGPQRLVSTFIEGSRLSLDYRMSLFLYAVPIAAAVVLALVLIGRYRAWAGILSGTLAVTACWFLKGEVARFPFHRLAQGAYLAAFSGTGLMLAPLIRLTSKR